MIPIHLRQVSLILGYGQHLVSAQVHRYTRKQLVNDVVGVTNHHEADSDYLEYVGVNQPAQIMKHGLGLVHDCVIHL